MNILVVDDNAQVRKMLSGYLAKNGHHVEMANDGRQGWDLISRPGASFDLVFTDIKMPVMNGLELLELIKENNLDIPVIIMTGYAVIELTLKAFKLGAYDFLTKPFEFEPLLTTLEKIESLKVGKQEMVNIARFYESNVSFTIPSKTKFLNSLIPTLQLHYKYICELYHQDVHTIASCLFEALRNAIVYGNLEIDPALKEQSLERLNEAISTRESNPVFAERQVTVRAEICQHRLVFEIEDMGKGFDVTSLPDFQHPTGEIPGGRGLFIVYNNMDEVTWNDTGNCIRMVKFLKRD